MVLSLILDSMQTLTQSLDPRRLSMLKAMGVELWWAKAAKTVDAAASAPALAPAVQEAVKAAPAAGLETGASQPLIAQRAEPAPLVAPPETPGAEAAPVASPAAAPARARVSGLAAPAPATSASAPPVLWTMPAPWKAQLEQAEAPPPTLAETASASGLLLLVDDLQALGDAQPAAMQLLENMVRAMGLLHSPALRLSWAKRPQHGGAEAATPQQDAPSASVQQLLANASPRVVLVMGRDAAQHWLGRTEPLGVLRQSDHQVHGVPVVVSFSPAYLLRATHAKRQAWADLQRVMALLAPTTSS